MVVKGYLGWAWWEMCQPNKVRYSKADNTTVVSTWVIRGTKRVIIFYFIQ